jgi:ATP-dependent Clp protease ATP-binding subunit ClpA
MPVVIQIVKKFIGELNSQLKDKGIEIVADAEALRWIADKGYDSKMGARPLSRLIDTEIKSPLSRRVLFGDLVDGGRINISIVDNKLDFTVTEIVKPLSKEQRKAAKLLALDKETADDGINQDNQS